MQSYTTLYKVVYDCIIYVLFYILAYIQHNGDVSLEKKDSVVCLFFFARGLILGKNRNL